MTPSELSDLLWAQVDRVAPHLLPNGKKEGHEWVAGNVNGDKGNSLKVNLSGKKKWADFAEGDGGDMLDLWMACRGINLHQAMQEAKAFLGIKDDDHHFDAKREKKFSRPDRKKIARYVIRFAEREGVPLHTTDLLQPTSRVGKMAQTTAENIPLAGTSGMRATQQEARSQLVQRFADKFGEYDPAVVIDSLKAKTSGIRRAAGNRLEQVQNAMAGVNIQPARAIQQIDTEISNLQKLGKVADNETISKLQSYRDELVRNAGPDGPVNLDLKQLSDLRSQFRMDVKGERPVLPNRSDAAIQRVYKAMTDDINGAIGQNLGNDTLRKYQQANAVYADEAAKLKNTRLKNVLMKGDLTPEVVNNMLFSKNKSEIKTLYNSVGRVGRAQMRNGIIGKAMEKSGGSPDQFLRQLNILQNQTGITFKGQEAAYLKGLKNYLQSTQQAAKAAVTTPTGQQTIPFIIGYGTAMNPATTGAAVSYGLLTRAYESEPFRNAMLRMANTPRGSTAFEKAMQQAQKAINALTQGAKSDALSE